MLSPWLHTIKAEPEREGEIIRGVRP